MSATDTSNETTTDVIRQRVAACRKLMDDFFEKDIINKDSVDDIVAELRKTGCTDAEAADYLGIIRDRVKSGAGGQNQASGSGDSHGTLQSSNTGNGDATPPELEGDELEAFRNDRAARRKSAEEAADRERAIQQEKAAREAGWAVFASKLAALAKLPEEEKRREKDLDFGAFSDHESEDDSSSSVALPKSLLKVAPHLADVVNGPEDPYLRHTRDIRREYIALKDKVMSALVDSLKESHGGEPMPPDIWKTTLKDGFVDLTKVNAAFHVSSGRFEEGSKETFGSFVLTQKQTFTDRKTLHGEADWLRSIEAWIAMVLRVYPHRSDELSSYKFHVRECFHRYSGQVSAVLAFDVEVRERYSRRAFRLDDDTQTNPILFGCLHNTPTPKASSSSSLENRLSSPSTRKNSTCLNWNYGRCVDGEKCPFGRQHGRCSVCGGQHRASEEETCRLGLKAREGKRNSLGEGEGGSSKKRPKTY